MEHFIELHISLFICPCMFVYVTCGVYVERTWGPECLHTVDMHNPKHLAHWFHFAQFTCIQIQYAELPYGSRNNLTQATSMLSADLLEQCFLGVCGLLPKFVVWISCTGLSWTSCNLSWSFWCNCSCESHFCSKHIASECAWKLNLQSNMKTEPCVLDRWIMCYCQHERKLNHATCFMHESWMMQCVLYAWKPNCAMCAALPKRCVIAFC